MLEEIYVQCKCGATELLYLEDGEMEGVLTARIEGGRLEGVSGGSPDGKFYVDGEDIFHKACSRSGICTILGKERL